MRVRVHQAIPAAKTTTAPQDRSLAPGANPVPVVDAPEPLPDIPTQLMQARRLGHRFDRIGILPEHAPVHPNNPMLQRAQALSSAHSANQTGLPDDLKAGIETLAGLSLDGVQVQYNSPKPAQVQALAYTQGTTIHVAPGQEQHLAHEAWHVVQQAQGRVQPTMQMESGLPVNDDARLEHEADVMGAKALQRSGGVQDSVPYAGSPPALVAPPTSMPGIVQAVWNDLFPDDEKKKGKRFIWEPPLGGLTWEYNTETKLMRFAIADKAIIETYPPTIATTIKKLQKNTSQPYEAWLKQWQDLTSPDPTKEHKRAFATYVDQILSSYPPDSHIYVGIGASCDLILTYMHLVHGQKITSVSIPISAANRPSDEWPREGPQRLQEYITNAVGKHVIDATNMKLLVMDVTSGGMSLKNICDALGAVLRAANKNPERIRRLSLNKFAGDKPLTSKTPGAIPTLDGEMMGERALTHEEQKAGVVKKGEQWIEETDDETLEPAYYPSEYDMFIRKRELEMIGKYLDDMEYKDIGRRYDKIKMEQVMSGEIKSADPFHQQAGEEALARYAKKLLAE